MVVGLLWWWRESGGWDCVCEGPDEFNFLISEMASLVALFLVSEMHLFLFVYFVYIVTFCHLTPQIYLWVMSSYVIIS